MYAGAFWFVFLWCTPCKFGTNLIHLHWFHGGNFFSTLPPFKVWNQCVDRFCNFASAGTAGLIQCVPIASGCILPNALQFLSEVICVKVTKGSNKERSLWLGTNCTLLELLFNSLLQVFSTVAVRWIRYAMSLQVSHTVVLLGLLGLPGCMSGSWYFGAPLANLVQTHPPALISWGKLFLHPPTLQGFMKWMCWQGLQLCICWLCRASFKWSP